MTFKLPPPPDPKDSRFYQWITLMWKYITGVWTATQGGTGQSSYAIGDILYADTTTTLAKLPDVASGKPLLSGGVGVAPAWGAAAVGTVTSVAVSGANGIGVSGSPITTSGTVALSLGAITPTSIVTGSGDFRPIIYDANQSGGIQIGTTNGYWLSGLRIKSTAGGIARTALDATDGGVTGATVEAITLGSTASGGAGYVGIGQTAPAYILDILETKNAASRFQFSNLNTGTAAQVLWQLVNNTGNAGQIGITGSNYDGTAAPYAAQGGEIFFQGNAGPLLLRAGGANPIRFSTNTSEKMRIAAGGNVGIGVDPAYKLDILETKDGASRFQFSNLSTGTTAQILYQLANSAGNTAQFIMTGPNYDGTAAPFAVQGGEGAMQINNGPLLLRAGGSNYIRFSTGTTEKVRITSSGNVGIGNAGATTIGNSNHVQVAGTTAATNSLGISAWSADALGSRIELGKSRGAAIGTNTIVQSGDVVASVTGYGANGSTFTNLASISMEVDGTPGATNDMPGRIVFNVTPDGSGTLGEAMRLSQDKSALFAATVSATNLTAWAAYTTTRTGWTDVGAAPTVTARQCQVRNVCHFQIKVIPGTTVATVAGTSYCSLPITAAGIGGAAIMTDVTTMISIGNCVIDVANSRVYVPTQTATGDTLTICGWYEV